MNKLKPIHIDNGVIEIHPLRENELMKLDRLENDVFEILSDFETTKFIPEKRVSNKKVVSDKMIGVTLDYEVQRGYTHFVTLKEPDEIIGVIDINTPKKVAQNYPIEDTWLIEFFLHKQLWGNGIMSGAVKAIIQNMKAQGISNIGALCRPENIGSIRILEKCGFEKVRQFDDNQDYYELK